MKEFFENIEDIISVIIFKLTDDGERISIEEVRKKTKFRQKLLQSRFHSGFFTAKISSKFRGIIFNKEFQK